MMYPSRNSIPLESTRMCFTLLSMNAFDKHDDIVRFVINGPWVLLDEYTRTNITVIRYVFSL